MKEADNAVKTNGPKGPVVFKGPKGPLKNAPHTSVVKKVGGPKGPPTSPNVPHTSVAVCEGKESQMDLRDPLTLPVEGPKGPSTSPAGNGVVLLFKDSKQGRFTKTRPLHQAMLLSACRRLGLAPLHRGSDPNLDSEISFAFQGF